MSAGQVAARRYSIAVLKSVGDRCVGIRLGLQFVYDRAAPGKSNGVFLSGNGPTVEVLQHTLKAPSRNRLGWRCHVLKRLLSREIWGFSFKHIPRQGPCRLRVSIDASEQLGYHEGYRFLEIRKRLIMSILRIHISALWRRYSWFESMRGSHSTRYRLLMAGYPRNFFEYTWHRPREEARRMPRGAVEWASRYLVE